LAGTRPLCHVSVTLAPSTLSLSLLTSLSAWNHGGFHTVYVAFYMSVAIRSAGGRPGGVTGAVKQRQ